MIELSTSEKVAIFLRTRISSFDSEEFWAMALNPQCQLIQARMLFKGTIDQCFFHPRDVFRFALIQNASFVVVGHNHPSGNPEPSPEDVATTKRILEIGKLMQIPLLDHVIVINNGQDFYSFKKKSQLGLAKP